MFNSKKFYPFVVAGFLAFSSAAHASIPTHTYDFGSFLYGVGALPALPSSPSFAQLLATDNSGGNWSFTLNLLSGFSTFGTSAFVGVMAVDGFRPGSTSIASGTWGVTSVGTSPGAGPTIPGVTNIYDFRYVFGQKSEKFIAGESVSWDVTGMPLGSLHPGNGSFALHVQGLSTAQYGTNSAWYVSPVPEPETYAMMLAGLGLMGFMARRRKTNALS